MPFDALKEADKQAFLTRLADRGRPPKMAQQVKDLVVGERGHVILSADTARQHQLEIRRPANTDELCKWVGIPPRLHEKSAHQAACFRDNAILENMLHRTKLLERKVPEGKTLRHLIADDQDSQTALRAMGRLYVTGRLREIPPRWPLYILEEIDRLTKNVDVYFGTWVDIVIKSGGTLEFGPPGPYTVVAHSLTVEPGGKIVTNQSHVSYDCTYLTVQ